MRAARWIAPGAAALAAGWFGPGTAPHVPAVARLIGVRRSLPSLGGAIAITFDDGPHPQGTPAVLEVLREHRAVATFFVVGEQVRRTGGLLAEIRAAGHAVAIHGDRHRNCMRLTPAAVREDLARAAATLGPAALPVHRAPYGIYTPAALQAVRARGWAPLLWSRWGRDWRARATPDGIAREATDGLAPGDVLLLHDADDYSAPGSWRATAAALPRILDAVAAAGLGTAAVTAEAVRGGSTAAGTSGARPPSR